MLRAVDLEEQPLAAPHEQLLQTCAACAEHGCLQRVKVSEEALGTVLTMR